MAKLRKNSGGALNILFTCIGRRVSLLKSFAAAARQLKVKSSLLGTDTTELSPALQLCDKKFLVKPTSHPGYVKQLLEIVADNKVKLLVPTVDLDLKVLAKNKARFAELGCCVLVSAPEVIEICQDKRKTHRFLQTNGFDTPVTMSVRSALVRSIAESSKFQWPCFLKPWDGFASRGTAIAHNRNDLLFYAKKVPNPICQELIDGAEYTCDVYVDFDMKVRCVVPRMRIEVRSGEVSKGRVVKDAHIISQAAKLVETLGAGPGVITLQLFLNNDKKVKFIEVNPRFGGGAPLSIKAGANFPKWIMRELLGRKVKIGFDNFEDGLTMLRYDGEVWIKK
ncbi:ATP-grasp domain-containing protein [Planctomycetota bacterium]